MKVNIISNHSVPYYAGLSFRTLVPKQPDLSRTSSYRRMYI